MKQKKKRTSVTLGKVELAIAKKVKKDCGLEGNAEVIRYIIRYFDQLFYGENQSNN